MVALFTSLVAAVLMLAQRSIKRLLVLSSIEDFGFLLLGVASMRSLGQDGVLLAAASHALGKSLLFIAIAAPERDGALARGDTGLAGRYPLSAFGFLMGMLTLTRGASDDRLCRPMEALRDGAFDPSNPVGRFHIGFDVGPHCLRHRLHQSVVGGPVI